LSDPPEMRLGDVLGAMSYALDLAEGQAAGHALRACVVAMGLAERLELDAGARSELFYAALLKDVGCSSNAGRVTAMLSADDFVAKRESKLTDFSRAQGRARFGLRVIARDRPLRERVERLVEVGRQRDVNRAFVRLRCERGAQIADGLGFPPATAAAIYCVDEHWDGSGHPDGRRADQTPQLARIMGLAQTLEVFTSARGAQTALAVARRRRGRWFEPELVDALDADLLTSLPLDGSELLEALCEHEPSERVVTADEERVTRIAHAFAEVIDAKSPSTAGHSHAVAALAVAAAERLGREPDRTLVRAALLHDIGKLGVSNQILDKPGPLTPHEWSHVRRHPTHTNELLRRVGPFRRLAATAAAHHERMDGSGYPRGLTAPDLSPDARLIAVADAYEAMTSDRSYRMAVPPEHAVRELRHDVKAGRLDGDCVEALASFVCRPPAAAQA